MQKRIALAVLALIATGAALFGMEVAVGGSAVAVRAVPAVMPHG
jgi:hypothetical protein